ncbi:DinB family protein [Naumannella halotolerans]|uniref:Uncharacterized protein DUF664 n=1 Tax=Naumannella halotolerans TaxID=993414 RepID=A0A4R7JCE8_9ACTN|nr:DinB family protein [Naumannella halotolerans]TDT34129.1 uncharacterized protein DUF664 [Naumannella halotolerans]
MGDEADHKAYLKRYLQSVREALVWKLEGLSEYQARRPMTPTGTNLAGIVKHCANVEIGYFGPTFGRSWPTEEAVTDQQFADDPQLDWYLTENQDVAWVLDFYRRVWVFADATIDQFPLDSVGTVPHWPADRNQRTLAQIVIHVLSDLDRHAGHADILREQIDGAAGLQQGNDNLYGGDWDSYVQRLERLAKGS